MLQVVDFNEQLKEHILNLENACTKISTRLEEKYQSDFQRLGVDILVECIRNVRGRKADRDQVFETYYESYIEIGIEEENEYFPNAYIPIWKCKKEMFQEVGYLTSHDLNGIENKVNCILQEMLQERQEQFVN